MGSVTAEFDDGFERLRLHMLARQFPELVRAAGEVAFAAEDDEDRLIGATWSMENGLFSKASESGFKLYLMELLDIFIRYRAQSNYVPRKKGIVNRPGFRGGCLV